MENTEAIKRFIRVVEMGSFTQAANGLGLPKASVSQAVQQLETQLGTQLLHRTTRKVSLTPDGQLFYDKGKDLLAELEELETLFISDDANIAGTIRVDMSQPMARNLVIPNLPPFLERHPNLHIELSSTDRHVDLIAEGLDCVVRTGKLSDSGLIVRQLGQLSQKNYASPAYIARYGKPETLEDLAQHWLVQYNIGNPSQYDTFIYCDGGNCKQIRMKSKISVNNVDAYRAACVAGLGIIQAPHLGASQLIQQGQLIEVLSEYTAPAMPVSILYPHKRNLSKRVRIFIDWLTEQIKPYTQ